MIALILGDNAFEQDIRELLMAYFPGHGFVHTEEEAAGASLVCRGGREGSACGGNKASFVLAGSGGDPGRQYPWRGQNKLCSGRVRWRSGKE